MKVTVTVKDLAVEEGTETGNENVIVTGTAIAIARGIEEKRTVKGIGNIVNEPPKGRSKNTVI